MTMQSSNTQAQAPRGPMGGRGRGFMGHGGPMAMMQGEKPRDFKGTMKKLLQYLGSYKLGILVVMLFAMASTVFSIAGPKGAGAACGRAFCCMLMPIPPC